MKWLVSAVVAVLGVVSVASSTYGVAMHGEGPGVPRSDCGPVVNWRFTGSGWTSSTKGYVREGFNYWNGVKDFSGAQMVGNAEVWTGFEVDVLIDNSLEGWGLASCSGGYIKLNPGSWSADLYRRVASHELGHTLSLAHTGGHDDLNWGFHPMMSTCLSASQAEDRIISSDDYAQLNTFRTDETELPNGGFESGGGFWAAQGTATYSTSSSYNDTGGWHGILSASGSHWGDYVFTRTSKMHTPGQEHAVVFRYRTVGMSSSSRVRGVLVSRNQWYGSPNDTNCWWPASDASLDIDANDRVSDGTWVVQSTADSVPSPAWANGSTGIGSTANVGFVELEFRIRNTLGSGNVHFDTVRLVG